MQERRASGVPTPPLLRAFESQQVSYLVLGMLRLKKQKQKPVPAPKDLQDLQVVEVSKGIRQHDEGLCGAHSGLHIPAKVGVLLKL